MIPQVVLADRGLLWLVAGMRLVVVLKVKGKIDVGPLRGEGYIAWSNEVAHSAFLVVVTKVVSKASN